MKAKFSDEAELHTGAATGTCKIVGLYTRISNP